ncbi:aminomethyl transferase family protein [Lactococcus garvieae]|nr:aminomethyl transferase family protein [Lactococcus garvieae]
MMNKIYKELRKNKAYRKFEGKIFELKGEDVEDILNPLIPKNIEFSDIDTCGFSFILTDKGTVYSEIVFYKLEDKYIIFSNEDLLSLFSDIKGEFSIKEVSDELSLIQIEGKESGEIAQQFYDYDISTLNFKFITNTTYKGSDIIMARFGYSGEFGYQFLLPNHLVPHFIDEFLADTAQYDKELDDYVKFEVNHPVYDVYRGQYNLFELGYAWNLDFTKEEFKGRKALLADFESSTKQSIVFSASAEVRRDESVYFDNQEIGKVYWVIKALDEKPDRVYLGMLQVERYYAHSGLHFLTEGGVVLETLSNPYVIPESWSK